MLVTDRRRLTAAAGLGDTRWEAILTEQIRGAVEGGVDLVQVREPDLAAAQLSHFLRTLFQNVPHSRGKVVVNDRLDVALAVGARGVHLPERGLPVEAVRRLAGPQRLLVGRSIHDRASAAASGAADYLIAGAVRASRSHPDGAVMGWDRFREAASAAPGVPVLAIGGLGAADVEAVLRAGGTGIAAIDWFLPASSPDDVAGFVHKRASELLLVFDSHAGVSYTRRAGR